MVGESLERKLAAIKDKKKQYYIGTQAAKDYIDSFSKANRNLEQMTEAVRKVAPQATPDSVAEACNALFFACREFQEVGYEIAARILESQGIQALDGVQYTPAVFDSVYAKTIEEVGLNRLIFWGTRPFYDSSLDDDSLNWLDLVLATKPRPDEQEEPDFSGTIPSEKKEMLYTVSVVGSALVALWYKSLGAKGEPTAQVESYRPEDMIVSNAFSSDDLFWTRSQFQACYSHSAERCMLDPMDLAKRLSREGVATRQDYLRTLAVHVAHTSSEGSHYPDILHRAKDLLRDIQAGYQDAVDRNASPAAQAREKERVVGAKIIVDAIWHNRQLISNLVGR